MKKQDFLNDVKHEIEMLKKFGKKTELAKLNFDSFDYSNADHCVYGQMTGSCASKRAKVLMDKSCIRVMDLDEISGGIEQKTFTQMKLAINGANEGQGWVTKGFDKGDSDMFPSHHREFIHLSALEGYIMLKGAKNKHIIKYLRGEVETLKL